MGRGVSHWERAGKRKLGGVFVSFFSSPFLVFFLDRAYQSIPTDTGRGQAVYRDISLIFFLFFLRNSLTACLTRETCRVGGYKAVGVGQSGGESVLGNERTVRKRSSDFWLLTFDFLTLVSCYIPALPACLPACLVVMCV